MAASSNIATTVSVSVWLSGKVASTVSPTSTPRLSAESLCRASAVRGSPAAMSPELTWPSKWSSARAMSAATMSRGSPSTLNPPNAHWIRITLSISSSASISSATRAGKPGGGPKPVAEDWMK